MSISPYAHAAAHYWDAGWRSVLPLPLGKKTYPPKGWTGRHADIPSRADVQAWVDDEPSNLALRLPPGVIGIDVDAYGDKNGGATLTSLVESYGALPATWKSSSRGDSTVSGIYLYRVPDNTETVTALDGIELIQPHHRYVVAWPSLHPEGRTYEWFNEIDPTSSDTVPTLDSLPPLPERWLEHLKVEPGTATKADLGAGGVAGIINNFNPDPSPCRHVRDGLGRLHAPGSRHDALNDAVLVIMSAGRRGCPGAKQALQQADSYFTAAVTAPGDGQRSRAVATAEFARSLEGAAEMVAGEPQGTICSDQVQQWVDSLDTRDTITLAGSDGITSVVDVTDPSGDSSWDGASETPAEARNRVVMQRVAHMEISRDADILFKQRSGIAPKELVHVPLGEFLQQPDEETIWRVVDLWPVGGNIVLAAAAKAGKTTMVAANLLPALADGGLFLGEFDVAPTDGRIAYFNLEVTPAQMRRWVRGTGIRNTDRVHVFNLRGRESSLTLTTAQGRHKLATQLKELGVTCAILDPIAPILAALGIDENSNTEVGEFFAWWKDVCDSAGITETLFVHHTGHDQSRSRGAAVILGTPDAIWDLSADKHQDGGDDDDDFWQSEKPRLRYFRAHGRDVEISKRPLQHDSETNALVLLEATKAQARQVQVQSNEDKADQRVLEFIEANPGCSRSGVREKAGLRAAASVAAVSRLVGAGRVLEEVDESTTPATKKLYLTRPSEKNLEKVGNVETAETLGTFPHSRTFPHIPTNGNVRPDTDSQRGVTLSEQRTPGNVGRSDTGNTAENQEHIPEAEPGLQEAKTTPTDCDICHTPLAAFHIRNGTTRHPECGGEQ